VRRLPICRKPVGDGAKRVVSMGIGLSELVKRGEERT
jgi:hypothetical protein